MDSETLAFRVAVVHTEARNRIIDQGKDSYEKVDSSDGQVFQRFETETLGDNFQGIEEELMDVMNWAAMTIIKLREARDLARRLSASR